MPRRPAAVLGALVFALAFALAAAGAAQAAEPQSWTAAFFQTVHEQQRAFSRGLSDAVRGLRDEGGLRPLLALVGLGFGYGVFHAVGPGHGKAVISAYVLTHESRMKRTLALAFGASLVQGLTALVIVGGLLVLVQGSVRRTAMAVDDVMEPVSYAAVLAVGLYLVYRGARAWRGERRGHGGHDHGGHGHHHHGHTHLLDPAAVARASSWGRATLIALSVGVRPCSGAVILLILAFGFGLYAGGVAAVTAMSVGTGITVAAIALTAQGARWPLSRLFSRLGVRAGPVAAASGVIGGAVIAALAAVLLHAALTAPAHPFM